MSELPCNMSCEVSVCMFYVLVIDAESTLADTCLVTVSLCLDERCSRGHPAADVAGEGCARGEGD